MSVGSVPVAIQQRLGQLDRQADVVGHEVVVASPWWERKVGVGVLAGTPTGPGRATISRGQIFQLAENASSFEDVERVLWNALAWGTGTRHRNNARRISSVRSVAASGEILQKARELSSHSPVEAFQTFMPQGRTALKYLGPAFFTKFMYFAGAGNVEHPSLIVDRFVLATLHSETGLALFKPAFGFGARTYEQALKHMHAWAAEANVPADHVEIAAFQHGKALLGGA